jgi:hypothetical protein
MLINFLIKFHLSDQSSHLEGSRSERSTSGAGMGMMLFNLVRQSFIKGLLSGMRRDIVMMAVIAMAVISVVGMRMRTRVGVGVRSRRVGVGVISVVRMIATVVSVRESEEFIVVVS